MPKFPCVNFIVNETNSGFASACNKGLSQAKGDYILFLNPDTLLAEDVLHKCLNFFQSHPVAGAVGVKMIDGSGKFLKESKRSFPSPLTSLYKLFGLSRLFPHSKVFSRYYLGHLDENKNHEADVLAGAFMMIRKDVLDKTGGFDEDFFMYGEDIDLSYRIQKAGFKNYYLAEACIIHFKGESTKRGSLNYVRMFYNAMSIFVRKHYGGTKAGFFNASIHLAIWFRALLSAGAKFIRWMGLPFTDAVLILFSFWCMKDIWAGFIRTNIVYSNKLLLIAFPVYTLVYLTVAYYIGLYDKYYRRNALTRTMLIATLVLLAGYALLPEKFRFSRGIILFGSLLAYGMINLLRWALVQGNFLQKPADKISKPYLLVAGTQKEFKEIKGFLQKKDMHHKIIGRVAIDEDATNVVAGLTNVAAVAPALYAKELIICAGALSYQQIISFIQTINTSMRIRFHAVGSNSIVSSDSTTSGGEIISGEEQLNLAQPSYRRLKRLTDVVVALVLLLSFPVHFFLVRHAFRLLENCIAVIAGKKTWIGYSSTCQHLPCLRRPVIAVDEKVVNYPSMQKVDYWYARNYEPVQDIKLIMKHYKLLGCY
jgi:GT2 family glycosyltransferase